MKNEVIRDNAGNPIMFDDLDPLIQLGEIWYIAERQIQYERQLWTDALAKSATITRIRGSQYNTRVKKPTDIYNAMVAYNSNQPFVYREQSCSRQNMVKATELFAKCIQKRFVDAVESIAPVTVPNMTPDDLRGVFGDKHPFADLGDGLNAMRESNSTLPPFDYEFSLSKEKYPSDSNATDMLFDIVDKSPYKYYLSLKAVKKAYPDHQNLNNLEEIVKSVLKAHSSYPSHRFSKDIHRFYITYFDRFLAPLISKSSHWFDTSFCGDAMYNMVSMPKNYLRWVNLTYAKSYYNKGGKDDEEGSGTEKYKLPDEYLLSSYDKVKRVLAKVDTNRWGKAFESVSWAYENGEDELAQSNDDADQSRPNKAEPEPEPDQELEDYNNFYGGDDYDGEEI